MMDKYRLQALMPVGWILIVLIASLGIFGQPRLSNVPSLSVQSAPLGEFLSPAGQGQWLEFGAMSSQNSAFEVKGWHEREELFVWSGSGRHEIWFMLSEEKSVWKIEGEVTVRLQGYVPTGEVGPRKILATVEPTSESYSFLVPSVPTDVSVPVRGAFREKIVLIIDVEDALRPRDFGSTDRRTLGVQLIAARLDVVSAAP